MHARSSTSSGHVSSLLDVLIWQLAFVVLVGCLLGHLTVFLSQVSIGKAYFEEKENRQGRPPWEVARGDGVDAAHFRELGGHEFGQVDSTTLCSICRSADNIY